MCAYVYMCVADDDCKTKKKNLRLFSYLLLTVHFFLPTGNQSLKGRASRIICDITNIRQTNQCLKFTQLVRKCVCIKGPHTQTGQ